MQWRKDVGFSIRVMASHTRLKFATYATSIAAGSAISPTVHPPEMVALYSLCELVLLRAQDAVVDESVELTPMSVPRGAGSAIAEKAQPLVETRVSLEIPMSWSCGQVPSASGFGEKPGLDCTLLETFTPSQHRATFTETTYL